MTFSALLLAGGESRRMGRDKAMVEFEGAPLWRRQLTLLRTLAVEEIIVSARRIPDWLPDNVELLLDDSPSRGPLSGLAKALAAMRTTHLLALAVDMPFMVAEELRELFRLAEPGRGVVPTIAGRAEPLAAIYPVEAAAEFQAALAGSDFSLQSLVRTLTVTGKVKLMPVARSAAFHYRNANSVEDFPEFNA
ncbi:MAG TPA: molybdenum cofactor guanylyltransferase [Chthoniobacterales bacterium]|nr:molybdenum cofactor guanylyltransferase [Chthoniobacterales bacterium]